MTSPQVGRLVSASLAPAITVQAIGVEVLDATLEVASTHMAQMLEALPSLDPNVGRALDLYA